MDKRIVITGPESSGKSTLTKLLAKEYKTSFVQEYAREYLEKIDRPYELEDVLIMAKEQLKQEEEALEKIVFFRYRFNRFCHLDKREIQVRDQLD